jgi:hypothetical protein
MSSGNQNVTSIVTFAKEDQAISRERMEMPNEIRHFEARFSHKDLR